MVHKEDEGSRWAHLGLRELHTDTRSCAHTEGARVLSRRHPPGELHIQDWRGLSPLSSPAARFKSGPELYLLCELWARQSLVPVCHVPRL